MEYKYSIAKRMEVAGCHHLNLDYESKCSNVHGHNWIITVFCRANTLNRSGMVIDFKRVKKLIQGRLDHQNLNEVLPKEVNPTAENIAAWILSEMNDELIMLNTQDGSDSECYRVTVQESEGNIACCSIGGCGGVL